MTKSMVTDDIIALSHRLADAAADVVKRHFRTGFHIDAKSDQSPVTIADKQAEEAIRAILAQERPHDGIHGEEYGATAGTSGYVWVLDPIDGTKAFATGRALFGTLIGLVHQEQAVLGIIDQPITKERWIGVKGQGTSFNGAPVKCRPCPDLASATIGTTGPNMFEMEDFFRFFEFVEKQSAFTIYGGDCYSYAQVASGWMDGVVEAKMKLHDYAALIPIIEGAGGVITDWTGLPLRLDSHWDSEAVVAAGDKRLHEKLCGILSA